MSMSSLSRNNWIIWCSCQFEICIKCFRKVFQSVALELVMSSCSKKSVFVDQQPIFLLFQEICQFYTFNKEAWIVFTLFNFTHSQFHYIRIPSIPTSQRFCKYKDKCTDLPTSAREGFIYIAVILVLYSKLFFRKRSNPRERT